MAKERKLWQYDFPSIKGEGWAKIVLREDGFFAAVSDYGNYAFLWTHHGCDDFRKFFLRVNWDYLCGKLSRRELDPDASFKEVKQEILRARRTQQWDRKKAKAARDLLSTHEGDGDWEGFLRSAETYMYFDTPHEYAVTRYPSDAEAFAKIVVCKRLRDAIKQELGA